MQVSENGRAPWVLWYDEFPSEKMEVEDFFERCIRFKEVEKPDEFRSAWRELIDDEPSIAEGANLRVFRRGVRPVVADAANSRGGKFSLKFDDDSYINVWHTLVSAIIGHELQPAGFLTGVVLSVKPYHSTIQVWVNNATAYDDIDYTKCQLRLLLSLRSLTFIKHGAVSMANPFEQTNPTWSKRVQQFQEDHAAPSSSTSSNSTKEARSRFLNVRSCRAKLTALEDPFLCAQEKTPEMELGNSSDSGSATSSDDEVSRSLKLIGVTPQMNRHGRVRRSLRARKVRLGNDEYEQALDVLGQANTGRGTPATGRGLLHGFIAMWTHFWLIVSNLKCEAGPDSRALESWDQKLCLMCYAIVCTVSQTLPSIAHRCHADTRHNLELKQPNVDRFDLYSHRRAT